MILVYIPARGGSKGIPLKNLFLLHGRPLISYTFDLVKELQKIYADQIIPFLSTDHEKILAYNNEVGFPTSYVRSSHLSTDVSTIVEGVNDALEWLKVNKNLIPDQILLLQPTSPFRTVKQAMSLLETFNRDGCQSMFGVIPMKQSPYECLKFSEGDWEYLQKPLSVSGQRQSYENVFYFIDGSFYLVTLDFFRKYQTFIKERISIPFIINDKNMIDIDEHEDMAVAESIMRYRTKS